MQMLDVLHSFVFFANLYSIFFVERCIRLVNEETALIKANLDFSKAFCKFFNDSPGHNVVKCR